MTYDSLFSIQGERRIRVLTLALPVTDNLSELYQSADQVAITTMLACKAVERGMSSKLEDARDALTSKCVDILGVYKTHLTASSSGATPNIQISDNLKLMPLLTLGMLKHVSNSMVSHQISRSLKGVLPVLTLLYFWRTTGGTPRRVSDSIRSSVICYASVLNFAVPMLDPIYTPKVLFAAQHARALWYDRPQRN